MHQPKKKRKTQTSPRNTKKLSKLANSWKKEDSPQPDRSSGDRSDLV